MSTVTWIGKGLPTVVMTMEVRNDMEIICRNAGKEEIGWLGLVRRDIEENTFTVYRILPIPKQEVHATTTELTPEGQAEMLMKLLETGEITMEETNDIRFWAHSHVNMGTSPSGQDNSQMGALTENLRSEEGSVNRYFVRCITNKKSEYNFAIFQYDLGIALTDAPWSMETSINPGREDYWKEQIKENVKELKTKFFNGHNVQGFGRDFEDFTDYGYKGYPKNYSKKKGRPKGSKNNKPYAFQDKV